MINKAFSPYLLISMITISSAVADTQLVASYASSSQSSPQTATILMKDGQLAIQDANGITNGFYDSNNDVVIAVDHSQKSYYEIDRALATQVGEQLNSVMTTMNQQMEKAMAGMSEAQKQQFKTMMPDVMTRKPVAKPAQVSIRKTGKTNKIAGIRCEVTEIAAAEQPVQQLCVASYRAAGLSDQEMLSLKKLGQFASQVSQLVDIGGIQQGQVNPAKIASAFEQIQGIPLGVDSSDGQTGKITAIKHNSVASTVFSVPKGYQKKDIMGLLAGIGH